MITNSLATEAQAFRDGIRLMLDWNLDSVIVESDSQALINLWNSCVSHHSEILAIFGEIQVLSKSFSYFKLVYVRCRVNLATHICAKQASVAIPLSAWLNETPYFLVQCIEHDCNLD